ncbi:PREDICTED: uncharacterized protein LOC104740620 [Camelina sativa]|uniref:Uncharacterized protein LOC104740620 n=1 Tax=Camelina sativa TaxID=90675 RepID=A0ABM0VQA3_CAMSA|nr:PREDICTED: uncharacterized protein LOC104740620 [Camelina sativa]
MEGLEKFYNKMVKDAKSAASSSSSSLSDFAETLMQDKRGSGPGSNLTTTYDSGSGTLVTRPPSGVSVWTCSKLCAVFFVAGVFVGYTLKRRVRKWASKLLRKIKDD